MPVELRKRAAPPPPPPPAKKKATAKPKAKNDEPKVAEPAKALATTVPTEATTGGVPEAAKPGSPKVGDQVTIDGFGGEVEIDDGARTTLAKLVSESKAGVAIFTYPKAATPGCTKQARLFRESHKPLTATGLSIYGLSRDTPKANANWKAKEGLPYSLLSDTAGTLIAAIGFHKAPKNTTRGIFVIDKNGKVLAAEAGGPEPTVVAVREVVAKMGDATEVKGVEKAEEKVDAEDKKAAATADEVADTAAKVDGDA